MTALAPMGSTMRPDGTFDHDVALIGEGFVDNVNEEVFAYLGGFRQRAPLSDTIEYKVGEIFGEKRIIKIRISLSG